jgi:hypothetical protein
LAGQLLQILAIGNALWVLVKSLDWVYYSNDGSDLALRVTLWARPLITVVTLLGLLGGVTGMAIAYAAMSVALWPILTILAIRSVGGRASPYLLDAVRTLTLVGLPAGLAAHGATYLFSSDVLSLASGLFAATCAMALSAALFPAVRRDVTTVIAVVRLGLARRRRT